MIPFLRPPSRLLPRLCAPLRSSFCIALFADDTNTILFRRGTLLFHCLAVCRCLSFALRTDFLPAGNFFFCGFLFPLLFLSFSPPLAFRCAARRVSLFLFCASTSFPEELFARVSIDMSFRSYLVLYMHTAVQTAGNKKTKGEMVTTLREC